MTHPRTYCKVIMAVMLTSTIHVVSTNARIADPRIKYYMSNDTDVDFGGIFRITTYNESMLCSTKVRSPRLFQYLEAMKWFLEKVNNGPNNIAGIKLGFVIVDDCSRDQVALARSMQFIRENYELNDDCKDTKSMDTYDPSITSPIDGFRDELKHIPVAAVLSASNSQGTIPAASLLSVFQMPLISAAATSEELNKQDKYQFFARTVPSDNKQASVIVDLLVKHDWRYISIVHSADSYGTLGAQEIKKKLASHQICTAYSHSIQRERVDDGEFDEIVKKLDNETNMSTIVLFSGADDARNLLKAFVNSRQAASRSNSTHRKYVFVASDAVSPMDMRDFSSIMVDSLFVELYSDYADKEFYEYFERITAENATNFWMKSLFQQQFNCSYSDEDLKKLVPSAAKNIPCEGRGLSVLDMPHYDRWDGVSLYTESLQMMVDSLRAYIDDTPDFPKKQDFNSTRLFRRKIYESMQPKRFIRHINRVINSTIDEKYKISQLQYDYNRTKQHSLVRIVNVGSWHIKNHSLQLNNNTIWTLGVPYKPGSPANYSIVHPVSICSSPCPSNEYREYHMNKCCWTCTKCKFNEFVNQSTNHLGIQKTCVSCPRKFWPDPFNKSRCLKIELTHMEWDSPMAITIGCLCFLGILLVSYTLAYFWLKREVKLMKATDIELSMIGLVGVMICYPSAYLQVVPPTDLSCHMAIITLHLGFTITYASLLVKTNRIYRLFNSAKYSSKPPSFIKNGYQILITSFFISIQIVILFTTMVIKQPHIMEHLPHPAVKEVELVCGNYLANFLPQIAYNMVLLTACSVLAFKTRTFPDNFNESKLIFLHTLSTSFLWLAFIPSYLAAKNDIIKSELLAMLLLIGSTLSTLCLHAPKIYAVQYLDETAMHLSQRSFASRSTSSTVVPGNTT